MTCDRKTKYRTRSGLPARVYATDGVDKDAIHGAIKDGPHWKPLTWDSEGCHFRVLYSLFGRPIGRGWNKENNGLDLVQVFGPITTAASDGWVYTDATGITVSTESFTKEKTMPEIDLDKKYRTRYGKDVVLYAIYTETQTRYPVHGAVFADGKVTNKSWTLDGHHYDDGNDSELDLTEVKRQHSYWLNVYAGKFAAAPCGVFFHSRRGADFAASSDRIACIRIEFEEGEGLEDES